MATQSPEPGSPAAVMKRYFLFNIESYEEKSNKKGGLDLIDYDGPTYETRVKFTSIIDSQGITVLNNTWFILGTVKSKDIASPVPDMDLEFRSMLLVCSKEGTKLDLQSHIHNYGIWSRVVNEVQYIATIGEDYIEERLTNPGSNSHEKVLAVVIKIWEVKKLLEGKYYSLEEEQGKDGKSFPKIIYLNKKVGIKDISAATFSDDFSKGVIGLTSGSSIYIKANNNKGYNLFTDKNVQSVDLAPLKDYNKPVTNVHIVNDMDESGNPAWFVFCTTEGALYSYVITPKATKRNVIAGITAPPYTLAARGNEIVVLDPENDELKKFVGQNLVNKWSIEEASTVQSVHLTERYIVTVRCSEKTKTVKVYDMVNNIIPYQTVVAEIFATSTSGDCIYFFLRKVNAKVLETLREKSNIDKLEIFLKKKHYDVAYSFAESERFSAEVLAEIMRYYGDYYLGKVRLCIDE